MSDNLTLTKAERRMIRRRYDRNWSGQAWKQRKMESVQRLFDQGYTAADVARMLGISRERVRQWAKEHKLAQPWKWATAHRIWSDEHMHFIPMRAPDARKLRTRARRKRRRDAKRRKYEARRKRLVNLIRNLHRDGAPPTCEELRSRIGIGRPYRSAVLAQWLGYSTSRLSPPGFMGYRKFVDLVDEVYREAGCTWRYGRGKSRRVLEKPDE